jgi:hypothetical protein
MNLTTFFLNTLGTPSTLHRQLTVGRVCKFTTTPKKIGNVYTDLAVAHAPDNRGTVL